MKKSIDGLKHSGRYNGLCSELEGSLADLKLHELEVDVTSNKLQLQAELKALRDAIENPPRPVITDADLAALEKERNSLKVELDNARKASGTSAASLPPPLPPAGGADTTQLQDRVRALETENANLKLALAEAKERIVTLTASAAKDDLTRSSASNAEVDSLRRELDQARSLASQKNDAYNTANSELENKKRELSALQDKLNDKATSQSQASAADLDRAKSELERVQAELAVARSNAAKTQATLEASAAEQVAASQKQSGARIKELEERLEKEKEEMMEALAQEVEDVESRLKNEKEELVKENARLGAQMSKISASHKGIKSRLDNVKSSSALVKRTHVKLSDDVKKLFTEFKADLRSQFSQPIIFKLKSVDSMIQEYKRKYKRELVERKKLHNIIQELKGNIRVYLRCRPPTTRELENFGDDALCVTFPDDGQVRVCNDKGREKIWDFEEVFNLDATQEDVFEQVEELVVSVLDGYNVCIFAYGQTGSGKTWTMAGPSHAKGVNTRAMEELFRRSEARQEECRDVITVSVLEVYNESIRDLLSTGADEKLEIRQGEFGNYVPGLTQVPVNSISEVQSLLSTADRNRSQACTNMNEHSSRSHMMLTISMTTENFATGQTTRGKLNLVDLAGSERLDKSGATGQALKEAQNINKSLSALGDVIQARATKQSHIPFRNSTLTYLLQV